MLCIDTPFGMPAQDFALLGGFWRLDHAALLQLAGPSALRLETDTQLSVLRPIPYTDANLLTNLVSVDLQNRVETGDGAAFKGRYLRGCSRLTGDRPICGATVRPHVCHMVAFHARLRGQEPSGFEARLVEFNAHGLGIAHYAA